MCQFLRPTIEAFRCQRHVRAALVLAALTLATLGQSATIGQPQPTTQPVPPATRPPSSAGQPDVRTPPQISAEDLLREFQKDRPRATPILPTGSPDEEILERDLTSPVTGRRMPDGYFLVDRVGRLTREGDWWIFVFEGESPAHPEPPLKLLPNQLLERMVIASEGATSSSVFVVSGEVTEFKSENYLLLRKLLHRRSMGNLQK